MRSIWPYLLLLTPVCGVVSTLPTGPHQTELHSYRLEVIGAIDFPWGMAALPDGRVLLTEQRGNIRVVEQGRLLPAPISGAPVGHPTDKYTRAMLDIAISPEYSSDRWIYLTYGDTVQGSTEVVLARGRLSGTTWSDTRVLAHIPTNSSLTGRLALDGEGHIFVGTASDAGISEATGNDPMTEISLQKTEPQDLSSANGKILRFNGDGTVPADNPFSAARGAYAAVWTYGHRNPEGLALEPASGQLWSSEHGPRGGDELNLIVKGRNYGWPLVSYGTRYDGIAFTTQSAKEGTEQPVVSWTPALAPSAIAFYSGAAFPKWRGNLLVTSLAQGELLRLVLDAQHCVLQEVIASNLGRVRALAIDPKGDIYLALELKSEGLVVRLVPVGALEAPTHTHSID